MPEHTSSNQDRIIHLAREAPSFGELIDIIEDLDAKCSELQGTVNERDETISDLQNEIDRLKGEIADAQNQ